MEWIDFKIKVSEEDKRGIIYDEPFSNFFYVGTSLHNGEITLHLRAEESFATYLKLKYGK